MLLLESLQSDETFSQTESEIYLQEAIVTVPNRGRSKRDLEFEYFIDHPVDNPILYLWNGLYHKNWNKKFYLSATKMNLNSDKSSAMKSDYVGIAIEDGGKVRSQH